MTKRIRSLASLLWDDGDLDSLTLEWQRRGAGTCKVRNQVETCNAGQLEAVQQQLREHTVAIQELEKENTDLREIIRRLRMTSLPAIPRAVPGAGKVRSSVSNGAQSWLHFVPCSVQELGRFQNEVLPDLAFSNYLDGGLKFDLIKSSLASSVLGHAESVIRGL